MSSTLLWGGIPLLISGGLIILSSRRLLVKWVGLAAALITAFSAWQTPLGRQLSLGFVSMRISPEWLVLGRRFLLEAADRPLIIFLYLSTAVWILLADPDLVPIQLIPISLSGTAIIVFSFSVEPIFYGALFFAFLALLYTVLLTPPGTSPTPGVFRFLITQILGIIFILFAAWLASWVDYDADQQQLLLRAIVLLALGFTFLLAVFPFSSWVPMLGKTNHPYLTGFVFNSYLTGVVIFGLRFVSDASWFQQFLDPRGPLQAAGVLMIGLGAVTAISGDHLGRIMSGAVLVGVGRMLTAVSFLELGYSLLFSFLILEVLALGLICLSLSLLLELGQGLLFSDISGMGRQYPAVSLGIVVGLLTLAGVPFFGGYPYYWSLGSQLMNQPTWVSGLYFGGSFGLIIAGLRIVFQLSRPKEEEPVFWVGNPLTYSLILVICGSLVILGIFPGLLGPWIRMLAAVFLAA